MCYLHCSLHYFSKYTSSKKCSCGLCFISFNFLNREQLQLEWLQRKSFIFFGFFIQYRNAWSFFLFSCKLEGSMTHHLLFQKIIHIIVKTLLPKTSERFFVEYYGNMVGFKNFAPRCAFSTTGKLRPAMAGHSQLQ